MRQHLVVKPLTSFYTTNRRNLDLVRWEQKWKYFSTWSSREGHVPLSGHQIPKEQGNCGSNKLQKQNGRSNFCALSLESKVWWMVMSPWKHWFKCCKDTGPCPSGLTEIETICYLSIEWIWIHLFIVTLHILQIRIHSSCICPRVTAEICDIHPRNLWNGFSALNGWYERLHYLLRVCPKHQ